MAKVKISDYSVTNSDNTDINSINIAEGCAPSGINNAIREVMVHLKNWQTNASGDGATFGSLVVQGTGSFTGAVTMSAGATLSGTNTFSGSNIISGNINSSGTNTFSNSQIISGNINSSGTNTFSGTTVMSGANSIALAAGSASAPSLLANGDTNTGVFFPVADTVAVATGGVERWRTDSSGNLGLGVTPSAWGFAGVFQTGRGSWYGDNGGTEVGHNTYYNDGYKYIASAVAASKYQQAAGAHYWYTAPSGTADNTITFTQAMTLDTTTYANYSTLSLDNSTGGVLSLVSNGTRKLNVYVNSSSGNIETIGSTPLIFNTAGSEHARITSGGYFKASNDGTYVGSTGNYHEFVQTLNDIAIRPSNTNASFSNDGIQHLITRSASSAYNFQALYSGGTADVEFYLRGDGNGYADGTWNNNGADYAEFFESANGQALTLGATVVLDGNKVREATDQDPASAIIGVVRPKEPSKASMVVGNTAWNKWANKYLTDDFDRYIMEDHNVVEWTDEEGKAHSYESHNIPEGITIPIDATIKTHDEKGNKFQHYKLNPAWDKDAEYVNRENRPEWNIIGLVGQVKMLKGQPTNDRWMKMRDVSATVEEWFIR